MVHHWLMKQFRSSSACLHAYAHSFRTGLGVSCWLFVLNVILSTFDRLQICMQWIAKLLDFYLQNTFVWIYMNLMSEVTLAYSFSDFKMVLSTSPLYRLLIFTREKNLQWIISLNGFKIFLDVFVCISIWFMPR